MIEKTIKFYALAISLCFVSTGLSFAQQAKTSTEKLRLELSDPQSPAIYFGETLISQYVAQSNTKPVFAPLQTLSGRRLNRNYPVAEGAKFEKQDHPHHRCLWFSFGDINGVDYWSEEAEEKQGYIVSSGVNASEDNGAVVLETEWDWQNSERETQANSEQRFRFEVQDDIVLFETTIRLIASHGDLVFGDTKEGAFAVRVGELMKVDAGKGGKIINDRGFENEAAWGKTARWVQYIGPSQKDIAETDASKLETAGVTILVHPSSFGYPGRWHVRTYGLFAHNPFGVHDFLQSQDALDDQERARSGGFRIKAGDEIFLKYLVMLHDGPVAPQAVDAVWKDFANR